MTGAEGSEPRGFLPVLTSTVQRRWTSSVFGIVAPGAVRRRPSEIARILTAALLIVAASVGANTITSVEASVFSIVAALPDGLHGFFEVVYRLAAVVAGVLVVTALVARRPRLLLTLVLAGGLGWAIGAALSSIVDITDALRDAGLDVGSRHPDFPVVPLSASAAILLAARPYVTRPTRRMIGIVFWLSALAAVFLAEGLPVSVVATLAPGVGSAAAAHLACGSPGGTPSVDQVASSLRELGVATDGLRLDPVQSWGRTNYLSDDDDRLAVEVVGRDSTDARLFAKLWRFVWYKDAGPTVSLRRGQQVEHEALVLLLAARSGARVPELVAVGVAGARDDALLVVRDPPGAALSELGDGVSDAMLDDAWANLADLHEADIAHGNLTASHVVVDRDGATGLIRFHQAETSAPEDHQALDDVQLLVTTADLVGVDRALAAAQRALGDDVLGARLPYLEPAALSGAVRGPHRRPQGPRQGAPRDRLRTTRGGHPEARGAAPLLRGHGPPGGGLRPRRLPAGRPTGRRGRDGRRLPGRRLGLGRGHRDHRPAPPALPVDRHARGGLRHPPTPPGRRRAVRQHLHRPRRGDGGQRHAGHPLLPEAGPAPDRRRQLRRPQLPRRVRRPDRARDLRPDRDRVVVRAQQGRQRPPELGLWVLGAVVVVVVAAPRHPQDPPPARDLVADQVHQAVDNVKGVLSTPRKALQLFGGNLVSQLLFAMALGAALHAYGESLPLLQLVVINSFASFVGGAAPVPGGMGVVEAGLIAGFTAAGIPQAEAVAATFTARMFTTYLPPIWGWFCFQWLRHHDYV